MQMREKRAYAAVPDGGGQAAPDNISPEATPTPVKTTGQPQDRATERRVDQMRSTQSRCSGFMSTERRAVTLARSFPAEGVTSGKNVAGRSATARWRPRSAAAANIWRERVEVSKMLGARGAKTTMSSSGAKAGMK